MGAFAFATFFGLGAFGFFVGGFAAFFAFEGDFLAFAADGGFFFSDIFFGAAFLGDLGALDFVLETCFFSLGAPLPRAGADVAAAFSGLADDANLNEPEAPFPLVCTNSPDATAAFRYFLMNGANFSESTL